MVEGSGLLSTFFKFGEFSKIGNIVAKMLKKFGFPNKKPIFPEGISPDFRIKFYPKSRTKNFFVFFSLEKKTEFILV
ncbi:hypothetical protein AC231_04815 [Clostridium pasteurianum]|nr:hypothetical protein AC231_04815 [Clostridium pasteurianum]